MKYLLKYNDSMYSISNSIATYLKNSGNSFQLYSEKKRTIFILNDSNISLFQTLKKTSKTHFYTLIFGKKYRISKELYNFLDSFYKIECRSEYGNESNVNRMSLVDLFAGTGSAIYASKKLPIQHRLSNDFCRNSKRIFEANFNGEFSNDSINNIEAKTIANHDILVAGFPCQPFSIAGSKNGLHDPRADVINDILRIAKIKKPRFMVLENVKHLKSINRGKVLEHILSLLHDLGYYTKVKNLNVAKITSIPQNRERIFILCFTNESDLNAFEFNFSEVKSQHIIEFLDSTVPDKFYMRKTSKLFETFNREITEHVTTGHVYQYRRSKFRKYLNKVPTLTANMGTGGHNVPLIRDDIGVRKLTPRECFRLQGFSDDYKLVGSDSTLYKLVGNAISVKVLELILERFCFIFSNQKS